MTRDPLADRLRGAPPPDAEGAERRAWAVVQAARLGAGTGARVAARGPPAGAGAARGGARLGGRRGAARRTRRRVGANAWWPARPLRRRGRARAAAGRRAPARDLGLRRVGRRGRRGAPPPARRRRGGLVAARALRRRVARHAAAGGRAVRAHGVDADRPGTVRAARWSPDGFRIAYLRDDALAVVAGDGTGARVLDAGVRAVVPAWRPGAPHMLAWVGADGRVAVADADPARALALAAAGRRGSLAVVVGGRDAPARAAGALADRPARRHRRDLVRARTGGPRSSPPPGRPRAAAGGRHPRCSRPPQHGGVAADGAGCSPAAGCSPPRAGWAGSPGRRTARGCSSPGPRPTSGSCSPGHRGRLVAVGRPPAALRRRAARRGLVLQLS